MKTVFTLLAATVALAGSVVAQNSTSARPTAERSVTAAERAFVRNMAFGNRYEIDAGRLAVQRGSAAFSKPFGRMMVQDHTKATRDLVAIAKRHRTAVPTGLGPNAAMLAKLRRTRGAAFDAEYRRQQITAHEKTLTLIDGYLRQGANADLLAFARQVRPVVADHLKMAREGQMVHRATPAVKH